MSLELADRIKNASSNQRAHGKLSVREKCLHVAFSDDPEISSLADKQINLVLTRVELQQNERETSKAQQPPNAQEDGLTNLSRVRQKVVEFGETTVLDKSYRCVGKDMLTVPSCCSR